MSLPEEDPERQQEPVPHLPRKFFTRSMMRDLWKIGFLAVALVAVITLRKSCGEGVGNLIQTFEAPPDAAPAHTPHVPTRYRRLTPKEIEEHFPHEQQPAPAQPAPAQAAPDAGPSSPGGAGTP